MANGNSTHYIRGQANWAKVVGAPRKNNFDEGVREWTIDVSPDAEGQALIKSLGLSDRLKTNQPHSPHLAFKQREFRADGTANDPIRIVDANGEAWGEELIGNGSDVDVKFNVKDYGKGKRKGVYIQAIRVLKLVPYKGTDFAPLTADDEYFSAAGGVDEDDEYAAASKKSPKPPAKRLPGKTVLEDLDERNNRDLDDDLDFPE